MLIQLFLEIVAIIQRAFELEILTSNEIKEYIKNNDNIELISYKDL